MINYRLLRDNKESGPYSEDELIAKGFKPYDLLWAEGKSAGWQYPSEIAAFKKYAPIVEEQPYDRFYKKQPAQKTMVAESRYNAYSTYQSNGVKDNSLSKETIAPVQPSAARPAYEYNSKELPARHIHVTLPSGNTVNLTTLVAKKETREPIENSAATISNRKEAMLRESEQRPVVAAALPSWTTEKIIAKAPVAAVENPVQQPAASAFSWTLIAGAVIGIATMVGLGIMIGLSISREKNEAVFNDTIANKAKQTARPAVAVNQAFVPTAVASATPVVQQPVKKEPVQHALVKNTADRETVKQDKKIIAADKPAIVKKDIVQNTGLSLQHNNAPDAGATILSRKLSLQENDFKTGAFGGISNLKLTLVNSSALPLETVQVEIDYILANKKVYKTETVSFKNIAAGAQATINAPASSRGVKISSRVTKINAKDATTPGSTATVKS